jgi:hypothetical protein
MKGLTPRTPRAEHPTYRCRGARINLLLLLSRANSRRNNEAYGEEQRDTLILES